MVAATYLVRVDWDNNGVYTGTGEDVTARVLDIRWRRGRDYASQLTGRAVSTICAIVLNNESGDYNSFKTTSPLSGNLLPGRKVQIQADAQVMLTMFVRRITPVVNTKDSDKAILECVGPLGYLNDREVEIAMQSNVITDDLMDAILDAASWPAGDRTFDVGKSTPARFWVDRTKTFQALRLAEEAEAGFLLEGRDGKIVFENRHHRFSTTHYTSQATFSDVPAADIRALGIQQRDPLDQIFNIFEAEVRRYTVGALAVLWTLSESGANSPSIDPGQSKTFLASFPNLDSATDAVAVDAWTTLVATTDYTANSAADGSGTNLTANIGVVVTKFAEMMKVVLTNNHATLKAFITLLQARGTPVTQVDPVRIRQEDATSKTRYGERKWPSANPFFSDTAEATDWADFHLGIFKSPIPVLAVTISANRNAASMTKVTTLNISDRVTVVATGGAGLGIDQDFFIEAEDHHIIPGSSHVVTYELSDAEEFSGFWVLDSSALGTTTKLAY